ncbi:hypothetical protein SLEP1_g58917 [Rubroshorea leprosula]|uniref:Uncharacterized protein n=1 Tax=Rubroshorea leprosula TaxID=152421 RepID=A0AAV5MQS8_9ROSI|nr:hypothetical protein SLEP1_g58917 [Rubroshorea leprosula]
MFALVSKSSSSVLSEQLMAEETGKHSLSPALPNNDTEFNNPLSLKKAAESPVVERSGKGHRPLDRTDGIVGFTCHPLKVSTSAACFVWSLHEERAGNGLILILYSFQNRNFTHIVLMPEVCFAASSITALWPKREPSLTHLASKGRRKARSGQLVTNIREAEPPSSDISNSETTLLSFLRHRKQNYLTEGDSRKGRGIRMRSERPSLGQTMQ